ncbi:hypothetical protein I7I50_02497 [Histoplasma capsulatum G186AR]|uniref:Uncharacterized protein n=1 Tax=Ajellomyces capsulatus TaxID=5037 RepID=A0A8H8D7Y2_AJECA|nr:hypothetical protein I7I52_00839 [Histoplasma capsulatum]QSS71597.1 hypothetical protein I7I50_02497 [Histoplasma capsulatum G186AR]
MHLFNLLATITITFLGVQTAIAVSNPMEQTEQTPQIELDNQAKQELQELLKQDFQGERCVRACYSQKPICNGAGAYPKNRPMYKHVCPVSFSFFSTLAFVLFSPNSIPPPVLGFLTHQEY